MGTSPTNSRRACLCKNGTYSKCCCEGELINQGIGGLSNQSSSATVNETTPNTVTNISNDTNL